MFGEALRLCQDGDERNGMTHPIASHFYHMNPPNERGNGRIEMEGISYLMLGDFERHSIPFLHHGLFPGYTSPNIKERKYKGKGSLALES